MGLELIVGPPNSGRAGEVLERLRARLGDGPYLVVPTSDDVARFERDLCASSEPVIGATIRTFTSLFDDVVARAGVSVPPRVSGPQRLALVRSAVKATELRALNASSQAVGFAPALDSLLAELGTALISPDDLHAAADSLPGVSAQERELARLYARYSELLAATGHGDASVVARAAVDAARRAPERWAGGPLFVYGFDDLTQAQLELIVALSAETEVSVAVNYADTAALAARAGLLQKLLDAGGEIGTRLDFLPGYTGQNDLRHVATALFEAEATTSESGGGIRLMDSAGERGEAEAVAIEIARLMARGIRADDIVIVLRQPAVGGRQLARVLGEMGVPATLEADIGLAGTAVGGALIALCRAAASPDGDPGFALAHLRADPASPDARADWAERAVARGEAASVAALLERWGDRPPPHLARVLSADSAIGRLEAVAVCARRLAEAIHRERAPLAGETSAGVPLVPLELRAALAAADLLAELAAAAALRGVGTPDLVEAAEALESTTIRAWHGPSEGRVRIVSPYRARGATATHLFCCSLNEGTFPSRGATDPLLGDDSRRALGIPELVRTEQDLEERYLFHTCVSRPTARLYLSWCSADDEGRPLARSPFVDEVVDLLGEDPESTEAKLTQKRGLAQAVPAPSEATTPRLLARSLIARDGADQSAHRGALAALGLDLALTGDVLALTERTVSPDDKPGPLSHPAVIEALSSRESVSAGSLENWIECSYRWFVSHELRPEGLEPGADPLWLGGVVHSALQALYADPPGSDSIPRRGDAGRWCERFREIVADLVRDGSEGELTPDRSLALARVTTQVEAFLAEEAEHETELRPRPDLLERSFGFPDADGDPGALSLGELTLRGFIDRIDVAPDGKRAVVRDYKTSKSVPGRAHILEKGKLQLPLYMAAARELLELDPIAGLYHPLASYSDRRPRGIALADECGEGGLLENARIVTRSDGLERSELDAELDRALALASDRGARMRAGAIARDPHGGACPKYCTFQPICRLERAIGLEEETANGGRE